MELFTIVVSVAQIIGISLGVGTSTLAVLSFFAAIKDGTIDEAERRMLGVIYIILRVAMVTILVSTLGLTFAGYGDSGASYFTPYIVGQYVLIAVLFLNAILMTARLMPSKFGPAIQAGSWYLLGFGMALQSLGLTNFTLVEFFIAYGIELVFATLLINGVMIHLRKAHSAPAA